MWPCLPLMVKRPLIVPRRPFFIMSPKLSNEVGSPTMHQSSICPLFFSHSTTFTVPSFAGPSSSLVISSAMLCCGFGFVCKNCSIEVTNAAIEAFISAAPRPYSKPSRMVGSNGSLAHFSTGPVGTTSV